MDLAQRKLIILQAIIDDYITTAVPVGSKTLSNKYLDWSSATIRNEMADLEEMGYLDQPHTSAGRVPSDKAYRLYVDQLMQTSQLTKDEIEFIKNHIAKRAGEIEKVIDETVRTISQLTQYTSVMLAPQLSRVVLKYVQLVPVTQGAALLVVVTDAGIIKDSILHVPEGIEPDQLYRISRLITKKMSGKRLEEIQKSMVADLGNAIGANRRFLEQVMRAVEMNLQPQEQRDLVFSGTTNIFQYPEFNDIDKARMFLSVLDTKDLLYDMLCCRSTSPVELSVVIGKEIQIPEMHDNAIVTATYCAGDKPVGCVGIIGPKRMNYSRVTQILHQISMNLSKVLTEQEDE